jgi:hypothetical protein
MLLETCLLSEAGAEEAVMVVLIFVFCGGCAWTNIKAHKQVRVNVIFFMMMIWIN